MPKNVKGAKKSQKSAPKIQKSDKNAPKVQTSAKKKCKKITKISKNTKKKMQQKMPKSAKRGISLYWCYYPTCPEIQCLQYAGF